MANNSKLIVTQLQKQGEPARRPNKTGPSGQAVRRLRR
ncbi:hypothetical protein LTSEADE_4685, partial [Salmonella enterica subsp. enterica serovar Adelaide str. A4-669]